MIARKVRTHFLPIAAVSAGLLFSSASRGADAVYQFDIPAESLTQALKDYSLVATQQLIFSEDLVRGQMAPALHGQFGSAEALDRLLKNSGLMIDRTPSGTVMVKTARRGTGSAPNPIQTAAAPVIAEPPQQETQQPQPSSQPPRQDEITVTGRRKDLPLVIRNYVTTYTATSSINRVARWEKPICPGAMGLDPIDRHFVIDRVKEIAKKVGAPVNPKNPQVDREPRQSTLCSPNVVIVFGSDPQDLTTYLREDDSKHLGYHYVSQFKTLTTITHPFQAWYDTATRDHAGASFTDTTDDCTDGMPSGKAGIDLGCKSRSGRASHIMDDLSSVFDVVTVTVDLSKITDKDIGAMSDYIALLALSRTEVFDSCSPLPSIRNFFAPECNPDSRSKELSEADSAYLKALYSATGGMVGSAERTDIQSRMLQTLKR